MIVHTKSDEIVVLYQDKNIECIEGVTLLFEKFDNTILITVGENHIPIQHESIDEFIKVLKMMK